MIAWFTPRLTAPFLTNFPFTTFPGFAICLVMCLMIGASKTKTFCVGDRQSRFWPCGRIRSRCFSGDRATARREYFVQRLRGHLRPIPGGILSPFCCRIVPSLRIYRLSPAKTLPMPRVMMR